QTQQHGLLFGSGSGAATIGRGYGEVRRPIPYYGEERFPSISSPQQYQQLHHPSSYVSGPESPHGPFIGQAALFPGDARGYPFSGPGHSTLCLPPILPSAIPPAFEFSNTTPRSTNILAPTCTY